MCSRTKDVIYVHTLDCSVQHLIQANSPTSAPQEVQNNILEHLLVGPDGMREQERCTIRSSLQDRAY